MKTKPLYKKVLYGFLVISIWVAIILICKGMGINLGTIESTALAFLMIWLFCIATDLDMGFGASPKYKIPEYANKNAESKKPSFDLMELLRLRPKKIDEKYKKYASLNRRMMASTIDTCIAMVTISPIIDLILAYSVHAREITLEEISAIQNNPDAQAQVMEYKKLFIESGKLYELLLSLSLQVVLLILASAICWKIWSATPGKMLLRLKIVDADTEKPMTNRQIIVRGLGYIPACAVFFIGIFWISFNKRRQGWHDKMANTVVIITSKNKTADITKEPA